MRENLLRVATKKCTFFVGNNILGGFDDVVVASSLDNAIINEIGLINLAVGAAVEEVIGQDTANICVAFKDSGTEVLITVDDKKAMV